MKPITLVGTVVVLALAGSSVYSQEPSQVVLPTPRPRASSTPGYGREGATDQYVSKEEHENLKQELETLKAQMRDLISRGVVQQASSPAVVQDQEKEQLKKDVVELKAQLQRIEQKGTSAQTELEEAIDEFEKSLKTVKDQAQAATTGTTRLLITGYSFAGYVDREGENSTFNAGFNPIFLWKLSDRIFFEGELEIELEENETQLGLEYGHLTYILNDCVTVGAGKFLTPFGIFPERLHPAWINKLPDFPLVFQEEGGLVPFSSLGVQLRGVIPLCEHKLNYAVYLANGPRLNTGEDEPEPAGSLEANNFEDNNNNKTFGLRLGYLFNPRLEVGYSFLVADLGESGSDFREVNAVLHGLDVSYVREVECLCGNIDFRGEWVWSDVDDAVYDSTGALGFGPVTFDNKRDGAYVQLAYRPLKYESECIKNMEPVVRYDYLNRHNAPDPIEHFSEQRWTLGVNYWLGPSSVVKVAYQFDNKDSGEKDQDAFLAQFAIGF